MTKTLKEINNPGQGDCAFYGFSIGLINIIQREFAKNQKSETFILWQNLMGKSDKYFAIQLEEILDFKYSEQPRILLMEMQKSLREILYINRTKDLIDNMNKLSASMTYCNFSMMVRQSCTPEFNELVKSEKLRKYAERTAHKIKLHKKYIQENQNTEKFIDQIVADAFSRDVLYYPKNQFSNFFIQPQTSMKLNQKSLIIEALQDITKNGRWGTHTDLNELASIFKINLHTLKDGKAIQKFEDDLERRPIITMNNHYNVHWTTKLPFLATNFSGHLYDNHTKEIAITKSEIKNILSTYTTGFMAFFTTRNHKPFALKMIQQCYNDDVSVDDIVQNLRDYVQKNLFTENSSFIKRVDYILARADYTKEEYINDRGFVSPV